MKMLVSACLLCALTALQGTASAEERVNPASAARAPAAAVPPSPSVPLPPPAGAQKQLDDILSQSAYHRWERRFAATHPELPRPKISMMPRWLTNAKDNFGDWLGRKLFSRNDDLRPADTSTGGGWLALGTVLKIVFWIVLGTVVLLIGWFALRALLEAKRRGPGVRIKPTAEKVRAALAEGAALALAGDEWLNQADALAGAGDFRAAYRALYLALLSGLHDAGAIHFRRSRTNWSYVRDFKGIPADRDLFENLTGLFDRVWYGLSIPENAADRLPPLQAEVARLIRGESPATGGAHA